jgi:microcystin-dependent protein
MTNLTRLGKTLKVESLIKTTYLPFGTFRISYDPSTLEATIYSVDTAAIVFDGVISDLYDVANSLAFTVPALEVFIASFNFGGSGGGSITDVTATSPLISTGGSTPNISIDVQPDGVYGISFSSGVATLVTVGGDIIGSVQAFAFSTLPTNYLLCNGTTLLIATYPQLFSVIGNEFGGDGVLDFNLPDLTGRFIKGDNGSDIGTSDGSNTLSISQLPSHSHGLFVNSASGNTGTAAGNYLTSQSGGGEGVMSDTPTNLEQANEFSIGLTGSGNPHEHPHLVLRYGICYTPFA